MRNKAKRRGGGGSPPRGRACWLLRNSYRGQMCRRFVTDDGNKKSKLALSDDTKPRSTHHWIPHSLYTHTVYRDPVFRKSGSVRYFGPGGRTSAQIGAGEVSKCGAILTKRRA